jgi:hypothetical protein
MITRTATTRPLTWDLGARAAVDGRLRQAAVNHHARRQSRAEVCRTDPGQLPVGVHLIAGLGGIRFGCPEPFSEADQEHSNGWAEQRQIVPPPDAVRQTQRRKAGVDVADDLDASVVQSKEPDCENAQDHYHK